MEQSLEAIKVAKSVEVEYAGAEVAEPESAEASVGFKGVAAQLDDYTNRPT